MRESIIRFVRFVSLGGVAAFANWLSRFGFSMAMPFELAVVAAYVVGMIVAFTLFALFVFPKSPQPLPVQIGFFILVNIVSVALVWSTAVVLARFVLPALHYPEPMIEATAHAIGIGVPAVTSYFGHRHLTFRST